jgi:hypothetical protein
VLMATALPQIPSPTVAEVRLISSIPDPVLRNLRITECYSRMSAAFAARTGACANWCTFATWASRQAGCTIRGEDMLARLDSALREGSFLLHPMKAIWRFLVRRGLFYPETRIGRIVREIHTPFDAFERASDAVARGNLKVFDEIASEFARYMENCPAGVTSEAEPVSTFLHSLRPGDPPDGQAYLRSAFTLYQQQSFEPNPNRRAQTICLANILIGFHEQTRLQPEIREAMTSVPETIATQSLLLRVLRPFVRRLSEFARELTCRAVTESLMVLQLPGGLTLQLSRNLDRQVPQLLDPAQLPEFTRLLEGFAATNCGADNWSNLKDRMCYISRLFCCFHMDSSLLVSPFTAGQLDHIRAGRVPGGDL